MIILLFSLALFKGMIIGIIILVIAFIIFFIKLFTGKQAQLRRAKSKYQNTLIKLRSNPFNDDLKEEALMLGKEYLELTGYRGERLSYHEIVVVNDINEACAAGYQAI